MSKYLNIPFLFNYQWSKDKADYYLSNFHIIYSNENFVCGFIL